MQDRLRDAVVEPTWLNSQRAVYRYDQHRLS
jgi:hypothetical protein